VIRRILRRDWDLNFGSISRCSLRPVNVYMILECLERESTFNLLLHSANKPICAFGSQRCCTIKFKGTGNAIRPYLLRITIHCTAQHTILCSAKDRRGGSGVRQSLQPWTPPCNGYDIPDVVYYCRFLLPHRGLSGLLLHSRGKLLPSSR
jgi:hypothetical protein